MHLPFSRERGWTFPEHLLDPKIGKKRALGSFQMLPGSHSSSSLLSIVAQEGGAQQFSCGTANTEMSTAPFWDKHIPAQSRGACSLQKVEAEG